MLTQINTLELCNDIHQERILTTVFLVIHDDDFDQHEPQGDDQQGSQQGQRQASSDEVLHHQIRSLQVVQYQHRVHVRKGGEGQRHCGRHYRCKGRGSDSDG